MLSDLERPRPPAERGLVSMHLLVLSAFRHSSGGGDRPHLAGLNAPFGAQCFPTPKEKNPTTPGLNSCLNAPFGAQCFPTLASNVLSRIIYVSQCTFWCSVLSDSRAKLPCPPGGARLNAPFGAQCFPTDKRRRQHHLGDVSQCTFWCSVLSDTPSVAAAFNLVGCLNAPFGAQCFPTLILSIEGCTG